MRRLSHALTGGACLALVFESAGPAQADDVRDPDEVVVRRRGGASGFVSQATIEDSPREVTDTASLIEPLPGVHVRRLGSDDAFATLSIRGASSSQVSVFLAGVPLTGGADPSLDLATLPLWPMARARVYRSFTPASLGRGSLGGSLVIDAPSPRGPARTEVWTAVGAFGARRLRIGDIRGDAGGVRIATGVSASRADDDFSYVDRTASVARGRKLQVDRANAGHAAASGLVSVAIPFALSRRTARGALTVTTMLQARRQEVPGTATQPTPFQRLNSSRAVSSVELSLPASSGAFGLRAWGRRDGLAISDTAESARGLSPTSTSDGILAVGSSAGWKGRPSDTVSIDVRLDGSAEKFAPGTWVGAPQPPGARRSSVGAAFDGTVSVSRTTTFAASARADAWFDSSSGAERKSELRPTGNVGVETVVGAFALAAHVGRAARPPSFVELYGNRGAFLGDPTLRPESAITVDGGIRITLGTVGPFRLMLEGNIFSTWADDVIVFVPQGAYGRAKAKNIGRSRWLGTEAELRATAAGFDLRISHTALSTVNLSDCRFVGSACERPPLPGRPEHDFAADLSFSRGPIRVRYGIDAVTGTSADSTGSYAYLVPDRVLHSTGATLAIPGIRGLSLSAEVRNLWNARVAEYPNVLGGKDPYPIGDFFDYPIPGRRLLLSLRYVVAN